jgi:hypothetical protein
MARHSRGSRPGSPVNGGRRVPLPPARTLPVLACATYALVVSRTWILQTNPKLYDTDGALRSREII